MNTELLSAKQLDYRLLQKEIKGISPKLSTYKKMEEQIAKLAEELGYAKTKKIIAPNWDKNVQVIHHKHIVKVDSDSRTRGLVFDVKKKMGKMNSQTF